MILIGASAGGIEALRALVCGLPHDLAAAVLVVLHVNGERASVLPRILSGASALTATAAIDGETPLPGHIYVARPGRHLLLDGDGRMRLGRGASENGFRPAIDALFRSAARSLGPRAIGVVLSGALDDGTAGLIAIRQRGGISIVQDPREALTPSMPRNALAKAEVDYCLAAGEIARLLPLVLARGRLLDNRAPSQASTSALPSAQSRAAAPQILDGKQEAEEVEGALDIAIRALEEQAAMATRMASRNRSMRQPRSAARFDERAQSLNLQAAKVRGVRDKIRFADAARTGK